MKSWKGDYLHRPDSAQGVTTRGSGIGNEWTLEGVGQTSTAVVTFNTYLKSIGHCSSVAKCHFWDEAPIAVTFNNVNECNAARMLAESAGIQWTCRRYDSRTVFVVMQDCDQAIGQIRATGDT